MGTKKLGWSAAKLDAVRFLAVALSVFAATVALPAGAATTTDVKKARDKIVEYNKHALASYDAKDFDAAKELLNKALKEAKQSGLDDDKMTARTYLHLGAVYWTGYKDQTAALQNFSLAKKIRPDIQLTPSIETPELQAVFDQALVEVDTGPAPTQTKSASARTAHPQRAAVPVSSGEDDGEPDLPSTMAAPLMCAVPDVAVPGKDLSIRCALKPGINAKTVQLHYRAPGVEAYQVAQMKKTPRGWWMGTLAGKVVAEGSLQIYVDARDGGDKELASNGHVDSPSIVEVRKGAAGGGGGDEDDPMKRIRKEQRDAAYEAGLHRRREGAVWVGMGIGSGFGFAPAGSLEARKDVKVSAVTAPVGMYHLLPEIGYLWSENFALSMQGIIEVIRQDQLQAAQPTSITASPQTLGWAALGRAIFLTDLASGNLQFQFSGDAGWGFMRIPVAPLRGKDVCDSEGNCSPDPKGTIYKTDARLVGNALLGASAGFTYHLSRYFAVALDGRVLVGVPNFGAMIEGWFSAQVSLGGKSGAAQPAGEGEDEGDVPGPGSDAPSSDPSSEPEEEEE